MIIAARTKIIGLNLSVAAHKIMQILIPSQLGVMISYSQAY